MREKRLSRKLRHPEEEECLLFFSNEDNFNQDEEVNRRTVRWGLRVNVDVDVDADAYVESLQTIAVKPPWIDSVANGGRSPYVFDQDSAPSHKGLKSEDWMVEKFHYHVTPHQTYGRLLTHQTLNL
ncbi:hypothetical protein ACTXT7_002719 [Hymenolepis weldensis]